MPWWGPWPWPAWSPAPFPGTSRRRSSSWVLGYAVALLALICGIVCIAGNVGASKVFGMLFCLLGLASLIYQQVTNGTFSTFDCLAMCFGAAIFSIASKTEG